MVGTTSTHFSQCPDSRDPRAPIQIGAKYCCSPKIPTPHCRVGKLSIDAHSCSATICGWSRHEAELAQWKLLNNASLWHLAEMPVQSHLQ